MNVKLLATLLTCAVLPACSSSSQATVPGPVKAPADSRLRSYSTVNVDLRNYIGARNGGFPNSPGMMLCQDNGWACKSSQADGNSGETKEQFWKAIGEVNYIGVSTYDHNPPPSPGSSDYYIGIERNSPDGNSFRCFSTFNSICTSPMADYAGGVPYQISDLPVVDYAAVKNAQINCNCSQDGSPTQPIAGELVSTVGASWQGPYWQFGVNAMDPTTCVQTVHKK